MAKVYFVFNRQRDQWRADIVKNSRLARAFEAVKSVHGPRWEQARKQGDHIVRDLIDKELEDTNITVVLISGKTLDDPFVSYEINESRKRGNALFGISIHNIEDQKGRTDFIGPNPFVYLNYRNIKTYDWVQDNGFQNLGNWVKAALEPGPSGSFGTFSKSP